MAIQKSNISINFAKGLDTKTDPFQVQAGNFLSLQNMVFDKTGLLKKRNGFPKLAPAPGNSPIQINTYNGGVLASGSSLDSLTENTGTWYNKGPIYPVQLSAAPSVRTNSSQLTCDVAVASNGLACIVWYDLDTHCYYQIVDTTSGDIIIPATQLVSDTSATVGPKVYLLGDNFVILYVKTNTTVYLNYISISINNPSYSSSPDAIFSSLASTTAPFDGAVAGNTLYISAQGVDSNLYTNLLTSTFFQPTPIITPSVNATGISLAVDAPSNNRVIVWVTYYDSTTTDITSIPYYDNLVALPIGPINSLTMPNSGAGSFKGLTSAPVPDSYGSLKIFAQTQYTYPSTSVRSDYISMAVVTTAGGSTTLTTTIISQGLASKPFSINGTMYLLTSYGGSYQPTYFLMTDTGNEVAKLAYSNGGGYLATSGMMGVTVSGTTAYMPYLFKDLLQSVSKSNSSSSNIYSQTGINIATFTFNRIMSSAEIGGSLQLGSGIVWQYDGAKPVELGFNLWPEDISYTLSSGGSLPTGQVFYAATYEWTDSVGNIHRSAPSVPLSVTVSSNKTCTVQVPCYRVTYKTGNNPVRIVLYRWSTLQPIYYQITSITAPLTNITGSTSTQVVTFVDTKSEANILGNSILYTTGGVVENVAPPAAYSIVPFKDRMFLIDAEAPDTLWYSKQVIQSTPVEMSDLFTIYIPTTIASGPAGPLKCVYAMDDKLVLFKKHVIQYIVGTGPDNAGSNNDFSDPVFVTATVGCTNQNSIVMTPVGLMFQSDKGIWMLGRDLATNYIGAPVEAYNSDTVVSALAVPGTNQVRFMMASGVTLMYDYYFSQWCTFTGIKGICGTLANDLHTYVDTLGNVYQESPGIYSDNGTAVTMQFTTSWIHIAGLQGYERAYFFYLLGTYISPHKLYMTVSYDYNLSPSQYNIIYPDNYSAPWGGDNNWGNSASWGGSPTLEQWRIFFQTQKCQSFQISVQELYDNSFGVAPGAGLTISGLDLVFGIKKSYKSIKASNSAG